MIGMGIPEMIPIPPRAPSQNTLWPDRANQAHKLLMQLSPHVSKALLGDAQKADISHAQLGSGPPANRLIAYQIHIPAGQSGTVRCGSAWVAPSRRSAQRGAERLTLASGAPAAGMPVFLDADLIRFDAVAA
jgi:hypothetical protein